MRVPDISDMAGTPIASILTRSKLVRGEHETIGDALGSVAFRRTDCRLGWRHTSWTRENIGHTQRPTDVDCWVSWGDAFRCAGHPDLRSLLRTPRKARPAGLTTPLRSGGAQRSDSQAMESERQTRTKHEQKPDSPVFLFGHRSSTPAAGRAPMFRLRSRQHVSEGKFGRAPRSGGEMTVAVRLAISPVRPPRRFSTLTVLVRGF